MDLAVYINELLGLQGEVSLPGIGYFSQVRINGYFNESENKFYPPTHEISFEPKSKESDSLAKFIADKKNISLASSKYFIDKYVIGIEQQLSTKKVEIAGLGYLYFNGPVLMFKAENTLKANDPSFYGFTPVNLHQPDEKPVESYVPPVKKEPERVEEIPAKPVSTIIPSEPVITDEVTLEEEQQYEYDEPVQTGRRNLWIALLLIIIIALLAVLGLYKYKPKWFDRTNEKSQTFVAVPADSVKKLITTDTTKIASAQDTPAKTTIQTVPKPQQTINAPVDTLATLHYEILGGAFPTLAQVNQIIDKYQKLGLNPKMLKHAKGNLYKITLGTFFNKDDAQRTKDSILKVTKLNPKDIYLQPYLPKK